MNLKVFIGACVLSGLVACSSVKQDEAGLSRPGVGLETRSSRLLLISAENRSK